jgi:hypothetical protein
MLHKGGLFKFKQGSGNTTIANNDNGIGFSANMKDWKFKENGSVRRLEFERVIRKS